jgi:hypothetical protein
MLCVDAVPSSTSDRATFRSHHDWNSHDRVDSLRFVPLNRLVPFLHIFIGLSESGALASCYANNPYNIRFRCFQN